MTGINLIDEMAGKGRKVLLILLLLRFFFLIYFGDILGIFWGFLRVLVGYFPDIFWVFFG